MLLYGFVGTIFFVILGYYSYQQGKIDGRAKNDIRKFEKRKLKIIMDKEQKELFTILLMLLLIVPQILTHLIFRKSIPWCISQGLLISLSFFIGCCRFYMLGSDKVHPWVRYQKKT
jgi:hypothetical protein